MNPRTQANHTNAGRSPSEEFRIQSHVFAHPKFPLPGLRVLEEGHRGQDFVAETHCPPHDCFSISELLLSGSLWGLDKG